MVYYGYPDFLQIDRDPSFTADPFRDATEGCGIVVQTSAIEGHNAMGICERYHAPLRRVYNAVKFGNLSASLDFALRLAVKSINEQ